MNIASKQIADSEAGLRRQIVSASFVLGANGSQTIDLASNASLKFFGSPLGCIVNSTSTDIKAVVASTGHTIQTSKNYSEFQLCACDGDKITFSSVAGATVQIIITDYPLIPVAF